MVDRIHMTQGIIEGSTYILLSTDKPPAITILKYGMSDKYIKSMIRRRKTCKFRPSDFVPSPWTDWLREKKKNS